MDKTHYIYYSYEEFGRGYIGVRSTKLDPSEDKYLGSFRDKSFKPTHKIVLLTFETREEAIAAEIELHAYFDVGRNPHFANKAKQTSTGFDTEGVAKSKEHRRKISMSNKGKTRSEEAKQKYREAFLNKPISEETKKKMSAAKTGKKHPLFGKTRSKEFIRKVSEHRKSCKWWNNGKCNTITKECPGPEWKPGRIKKPRN